MEKQVMTRLCAKIVAETDKEVQNLIDWVCLLEQIKENNFWHNFLYLSIIGQSLNVFDFLIIDLLWWRNTKRIRFVKVPEKELYQNPKKHIEAFGRAFLIYLFIAMIDGYVLTLF